MRLDETHISLKTGFGKYVGVGPTGGLLARADAIGPGEYWEPVFENVYIIHLQSSYSFILFLSCSLVVGHKLHFEIFNR